MRTSELVATAYAAYLAIVAALPRWGWRRRVLIWAWACAMAALVGGFVLWPGAPLSRALRDWAPAAYIFVAYYGTGLFFISPSGRFESWLVQCDARVLGGWRGESLPSIVRRAFESCYIACFLMIPAGFAVLVAGGRRELADRYWTIVLLAELGAFAPLPRLPARPPWAVEASTPQPDAVRRFGLLWVRRTSHCANTFPSGHTAGSLAVAFAVLPAMPTAGMVLLAVAMAIAIGCVSGRYHYAIDVVTGALVALIAWALVTSAHL